MRRSFSTPQVDGNFAMSTPAPAFHRAIARSGRALTGIVRTPGDKSISHRSIIFGALAEGVTTISGLLEGADIMSTIGAMRAFDARVERRDVGVWEITGTPTPVSPGVPVDCGNSGTGVRLVMGAVSAYPVTATFTGDASLTSRPMRRILDPLRRMGVTATSTADGRLPATITSNGRLSPLDYHSPRASAQVKSAILLAGLGATGTTTVHEPERSRDHTENMLRAFGISIKVDGLSVSVTGPAKLRAAHVHVPGDPSSAAFPMVAALITPGSDVIIENIMMNPTRTGLFETLTEMGAELRKFNFRISGGETVADIRVRHSELRGVTVPPERAPSMIDEYPVLAVASACAKGETVMNGIHELRVKESDRIAATASLLRCNGVEVRERDDGMTITGMKTVPGGGHVVIRHDHRIAMSALVLGLNARATVSIDDASMIATSFPNFFRVMQALGADMAAS